MRISNGQKNKKKKYSSSDLAKIIGNLRFQKVNPNNKEEFQKKLKSLDKKVSDALMNTEIRESPIATLVWALFDAMNNAKRGEIALYYIIPALAVYRLIGGHIKAVYKDKKTFNFAPLTIGMRIDGIMPDGILDDRIRLDVVNALDYASFYKIFSNMLDDKNSQLPAYDFIKQFGSLKQEEAAYYHNMFSNRLWEKSEPEPAKVIDMPGQPVSRIEVHNMEDILSKK